MTVKIYASRDTAGKEWAPDHPHEVEPILTMLRGVWRTYHHLDTLYCVFANMRLSNADITILTERGLGVIELKHYFGKIRINKASREWYAGDALIKAGSNAKNPHEQVQAYAQSIRDKFLLTALPKDLKRMPEELDGVKFQTAVCFTNPNADIRELKLEIGNARFIRRKAWESDFSVVAPDEICQWVAKLRFGIDLGRAKGFEPLRLQPQIMVRVIETVFSGVAWTEAISNMPSGEPYAHVVLERDGEQQVFNLVNDAVTIGRSPDCDIVLPVVYKRASKQHCKIARNLTSVVIEDLVSTNGTYVDGIKVRQPTTLQHGARITLGRPAPDSKTCVLVFQSCNRKANQVSKTEAVDSNGDPPTP